MLGVPLNVILVFILSSSSVLLVLKLQRLASVCFLPVWAGSGVGVESLWSPLRWREAVDGVTHAGHGRWLWTVLFILCEGHTNPCPYGVQPCLAYKQAWFRTTTILQNMKMRNFCSQVTLFTLPHGAHRPGFGTMLCMRVVLRSQGTVALLDSESLGC